MKYVMAFFLFVLTSFAYANDADNFGGGATRADVLAWWAERGFTFPNMTNAPQIVKDGRTYFNDVTHLTPLAPASATPEFPKGKNRDVDGSPIAGSVISCSACHGQDGIKPYSAPVVASALRMPIRLAITDPYNLNNEADPSIFQTPLLPASGGLASWYFDKDPNTVKMYNSRDGYYRTVQRRMQECLKFSSNGKEASLQAYPILALTAYLQYLATGVVPGTNLSQAGWLGYETPPDWMTLTANLNNGQLIYNKSCRGCHGDNLKGKLEGKAHGSGYRYPALAGAWTPWSQFGTVRYGSGSDLAADSPTRQAGIGRISIKIGKIWTSMPHDKVNPLNPATRLTPQEVVDVAAFVHSKEVPVRDLGRTGYNANHFGPNGKSDAAFRDIGTTGPYVLANGTRGQFIPGSMPRVKPDGTYSYDMQYPTAFPDTQQMTGPWKPIMDALLILRAQ